MKSAEAKAREFAYKLCEEDLAECNVEDKLRILLLEHERDTRYKAVEVLQEQQRHRVDMGGGGGWPCMTETVGLNEACGCIQNLEVSDD